MGSFKKEPVYQSLHPKRQQSQLAESLDAIFRDTLLPDEETPGVFSTSQELQPHVIGVSGCHLAELTLGDLNYDFDALNNDGVLLDEDLDSADVSEDFKKQGRRSLRKRTTTSNNSDGSGGSCYGSQDLLERSSLPEQGANQPTSSHDPRERKQRAAAKKRKVDDILDEEDLSHLSEKERELAIKRAKNREAARKSRERKMERFTGLRKDIAALQRENQLLVQCVKEVVQKGLQAQSENRSMQAQLMAIRALTANTPEGQAIEQLLTDSCSPGVCAPLISRGDDLQSKGGQVSAMAAKIIDEAEEDCLIRTSSAHHALHHDPSTSFPMMNGLPLLFNDSTNSTGPAFDSGRSVGLATPGRLNMADMLAADSSLQSHITRASLQASERGAFAEASNLLEMAEVFRVK